MDIVTQEEAKFKKVSQQKENTMKIKLEAARGRSKTSGGARRRSLESLA